MSRVDRYQDGAVALEEGHLSFTGAQLDALISKRERWLDEIEETYSMRHVRSIDSIIRRAERGGELVFQFLPTGLNRLEQLFVEEESAGSRLSAMLQSQAIHGEVTLNQNAQSKSVRPILLNMALILERARQSTMMGTRYRTLARILLDSANRLASKNLMDDAIDLVFDRMDELLSAGGLVVCNSILEEADPWELAPDVSVSLLTITLPAADLLPARSDFFERVGSALQDRGLFEAGVLEGLEG
jgi:hypothetical protein